MGRRRPVDGGAGAARHLQAMPDGGRVRDGRGAAEGPRPHLLSWGACSRWPSSIRCAARSPPNHCSDTSVPPARAPPLVTPSLDPVAYWPQLPFP
eukprot:7390318-Prymnesium_polylepis.2